MQLDELLEIQSLDTSLDQLKYELEKVEDSLGLTDMRVSQTKIESELKDLEIKMSSQRDELLRIESNVKEINQKIKTFNDRMFGSETYASRDLEHMNAEVESLKSQISLLEDREIEIIEILEPFEEDVKEKTAAMSALNDSIKNTESQVDSHIQEINARIEIIKQDIALKREKISPDLLGKYDLLRGHNKQVAISKVVNSRCGSCHLNLSASEVSVLKHLNDDSELLLCEQCGCILVH